MGDEKMPKKDSEKCSTPCPIVMAAMKAVETSVTTLKESQTERHAAVTARLEEGNELLKDVSLMKVRLSSLVRWNRALALAAIAAAIGFYLDLLKKELPSAESMNPHQNVVLQMTRSTVQPAKGNSYEAVP